MGDDDEAYRIRVFKLRLEQKLGIRELTLQLAELERRMIEDFTTIIETKVIDGRTVSDDDLSEYKRILARLRTRTVSTVSWAGSSSKRSTRSFGIKGRRRRLTGSGL